MEVMIGLFLIGVILTLTAQSAVATFERWQQSIEVRKIRNQIDHLPVRAFSHMREFDLSQEISDTVETPEGWVVLTTKDTRYSVSGFCGQGAVTVETPTGRIYEFAISPPGCRALEIKR